MNRFLKGILLLGAACVSVAAAAANTDKKADVAAGLAPKVLLVVSSEGKGGGQERPGFEMDEFAQAWLILKANGLHVDVASPKGGAVEADKYNKADDHIVALLKDPAAHAALLNTRKTAAIAPGEYQAVFVMGGKGAMFDLPRDPALQNLIAGTTERGGVVAAVCHGPAALAPVRLSNGKPLIAGRRTTGFTGEEEKAFGKKWAKEFPFQLEEQFRALGAQWEEAAMMLPNTVVDGRLITGQNPFSTPGTTEAVVRALGRTPVARTPFRDEEAMTLVQRWLSGEREAVRRAIDAAPALVKTQLIGMLGYYQAQAATTDAERRSALSIMQLAEPYVSHHMFKLGLAEAYAAVGDKSEARTRLESLIAAKPDFEDARKVLAALGTR